MVNNKKVREPKEISDEISKLNNELKQSLMSKGLTEQQLSDLLVPDNLRSRPHFNGRMYYTDYMEKIVWEEDD